MLLYKPLLFLPSLICDSHFHIPMPPCAARYDSPSVLVFNLSSPLVYSSFESMSRSLRYAQDLSLGLAHGGCSVNMYWMSEQRTDPILESGVAKTCRRENISETASGS